MRADASSPPTRSTKRDERTRAASVDYAHRYADGYKGRGKLRIDDLRGDKEDQTEDRGTDHRTDNGAP